MENTANGLKNKKRVQLVTVPFWQGRRDSNTQPTVLETATLPLSHSPILPLDNIKILLQIIKKVNKISPVF